MFVTSINLRVEPYLVNDLESLLLSHEVILEKKNESVGFTNAITNYARSGNQNRRPFVNNNHGQFLFNVYPEGLM